MRTRPQLLGLLPFSVAFLLRFLAAVCRLLTPARGGSPSLTFLGSLGDRLALLLSFTEQEGRP